VHGDHTRYRDAMTTPEDWQDPYRAPRGSTPRRENRSAPPPDAPPPTGPRVDAAPPPIAPPVARNVAKAPAPEPVLARTDKWGEQVSADAAPWEADAPWKRTWRVTMKRWGFMWLAALPIAIAAGVFAESTWSPHAWSDASSDSGAVAGLALGYLFWFGWWIDHLAAKLGFGATLALHTVLSAGLASAAAQRSAPAWVPLWVIPVLAAVAMAVAQLFASRVKNSFESSRNRDDEPKG
jgi:hypothetical protein